MSEEMRLEEVLDGVPAPLREEAAHHWHRFVEAGGDAVEVEPRRRRELLRVWAFSDFVAQACIRQPEMLQEILESGELEHPSTPDHYTRRLSGRLEGVEDDALLAQQLRDFRRREMVRIAWRDLAGRSSLVEVTGELSALADACIALTLENLYRRHCAQWGTPLGDSGEPQHLVVLGMGKLGAEELNFSSDVDLIFAYPEDGETRGGRRTLTNQEFFIRLGQRLIQALDAATADGFVFRVDMRLRPFGQSAALAVSFDAMETYYQTHGREWERYALIKARVVAGDREAGAELLQLLRPFIYRKYVDYGVFESLREMKAMIAREVERKGMEQNVKLGAGGIREIEFIGQAFQLIRGGREPTLRERPILTVLEALRGFRLLPDFVVAELRTAYCFLRNAEHRLQMWQDRQTHTLPHDERGRIRLALSMGFETWTEFESTLRDHMRRVHEHFEQVFAAPQTEHDDSETLDLTGVWQGTRDEAQVRETLSRAGFQDPEAARRLVAQVRQGRAFLGLSSQGRSRMNHLMPLLLGAVARSGEPDRTLPRLIAVIEAITRRSVYLALLVENPMALSQLVRLCGASPWIATQLARQPQLLDELLDPRTLYAPPGKETLRNELRQRLLRFDTEDLEQQMEALRHFKLANTLRVAAADVMAGTPAPDNPESGNTVMVVSDHLTAIAEVVLEAVLDLAWHHLVARHGRPLCGDSRVCDTGFAVVAYGKFGGIELGYGSDLDLVFLYAGEGEGRTTNGKRPVENAVFYARLAQRIIHMLTARTPAGTLYEVDTRLRPDGAAGLLVSTVDAFAEYQRGQAWTWEHQALVRARVVAGDAGIAEAFAEMRRKILTRERECAALRREVCAMRRRMRENLDKGGADGFDLKQGAGGIADIEFMVQYGVLAWSGKHPDLLTHTDNIRLLEGLARHGLMPAAETELLSDAYRAYRARVHRLTLQEQSTTVVGPDEYRRFRAEVVRIWNEWMGEEAAPPPEKRAESMNDVDG